jgi:hypothetical protein
MKLARGMKIEKEGNSTDYWETSKKKDHVGPCKAKKNKKLQFDFCATEALILISCV